MKRDNIRSGGLGKIMMKLFKIKFYLLPSIRRRYLYYFRKHYVEKMLKRRRGNCDGCEGVCCLRTRKCPLLKNGKCRLYKKRMPLFCKIFPIDKKDIELSDVSDVCQYYWVKEKK